MRAMLRRLADRVARALLARVRSDAALDPRTSPATKLAIAALHDQWRARARRCQPLAPGLGPGARIFSQFEEDGLLLYLDAVLELEHRTFVDIGAADASTATARTSPSTWAGTASSSKATPSWSSAAASSIAGTPTRFSGRRSSCRRSSRGRTSTA